MYSATKQILHCYLCTAFEVRQGSKLDEKIVQAQNQWIINSEMVMGFAMAVACQISNYPCVHSFVLQNVCLSNYTHVKTHLTDVICGVGIDCNHSMSHHTVHSTLYLHIHLSHVQEASYPVNRFIGDGQWCKYLWASLTSEPP